MRGNVLEKSITALSDSVSFRDVNWSEIPASPGVYVVYDTNEVVYVGMAGRNGGGNLRKRLQDHCSGQIVNMFALYLFLARVQFISRDRITHPRDAKAACHQYITERCSFRHQVSGNAARARELENELKSRLKPALNP